MGAATTFTANRMPAITWHKFKINEASVEVPELAAPEASAITFAVPPSLQFMETTINGQTSLEAGIAPVGDAFDAALNAAGAQGTWETGMGLAANDWLNSAATRKLAVMVPEGHVEDQQLIVRVNAQDGAAAVAAVDVVLQSHSRLRLALHIDSPSQGTGAAGSAVRIFVGEGATLELTSVQTLDASWQHFDDAGIYLASNARLVAKQTVLGAAESYIGFAANLAGRESEAVVDTRYLGHGSSKTDFNYIMRQRGAQSTCTLAANGVLMDSAAKTLRGTIDLIHGAKGAIGQENETVLLVNDEVRNKTIPIILCDEDDVQGAHGATIGHVNPEQLDYMKTRGLTSEQVEDLFAVASFDYAATHAFDTTTRAGVERLGNAVLGSAFGSFTESE